MKKFRRLLLLKVFLSAMVFLWKKASLHIFLKNASNGMYINKCNCTQSHICLKLGIIYDIKHHLHQKDDAKFH
jgi:hypothetical protein